MFYEIINTVKQIEEDVVFDVEAPSHWYAITYENNKLILLEIDEYHFNGDEWGEVEVKINKSKIKEINCTLEEYLKLVIRFFKAKMIYKEHQYPTDNYVIEKIDVVIQNE